MRDHSISSRLTLWFSGAYTAGLLIFGIAMWFNLEHTLTSGRSRTLERRADRLEELLQRRPSETPDERDRRFRAFAQATGGGLMEVFHPDGSRALPSPSDAARAFPWPEFGGTTGDSFEELKVAGQPYRVLARYWVSPAGPLVLRAAVPLDNNLNVLHTFRDGMLWILPAVLALAALGGYLLSRKALQPVDRITAATRSIGLGNLSERLPVPGTRDELQRLSETCNEMLGRLEAAVNEIKRFTADASHELRTPMSVIRTVAELALRNPAADTESRRAFAEIVEEAARTGRLLEEMLILARADDGSAQLSFEQVDLGQVIRVVSRKAELVAEARGHKLSVAAESDGPALIWGDYSTLQRLLWILLDNAVKYMNSPGNIAISLSRSAGKFTVAISDTGAGIPPGDLPHIFERFYRADRSRGHVEGSGLGLAIAKWIVGTHHAEITVASEEGKGAVFAVVFPALAIGKATPRTVAAAS